MPCTHCGGWVQNPEWFNEGEQLSCLCDLCLCLYALVNRVHNSGGLHAAVRRCLIAEIEHLSTFVDAELTHNEDARAEDEDLDWAGRSRRSTKRIRKKDRKKSEMTDLPDDDDHGVDWRRLSHEDWGPLTISMSWFTLSVQYRMKNAKRSWQRKQKRQKQTQDEEKGQRQTQDDEDRLRRQ